MLGFLVGAVNDRATGIRLTVRHHRASRGSLNIEFVRGPDSGSLAGASTESIPSICGEAELKRHIPHNLQNATPAAMPAGGVQGRLPVLELIVVELECAFCGAQDTVNGQPV